MIQITFSDTADQRVSVTVERQRMTFRFRYNTSSEFWSIDLSVDGIEKLKARRLVYGWNEFYFPFFKGLIICSGAEPTRQSLPDGTSRVYIVGEEELDAILAA